MTRKRGFFRVGELGQVNMAKVLMGVAGGGVVAAAAVAVGNWARLGAIFTLVLPLYVALFTIYLKIGRLEVTSKRVAENDEEISDMRREVRQHTRSVNRVQGELEALRESVQEHRQYLEELHDDHLQFERALDKDPDEE